MVNFSNLRKLEVGPDSTSTYTFYELEGEPWIEVRPATERNPDYLRGVVKRSGKAINRMRGKRRDPAMLKESRNEDRVLYAATVATGKWGGVVDAAGADVPFSVDNCEEFFRALPDRLFDGLRAYCGDEANFTPEGREEPPSAEEVEELGEG